MNLSTKLKESVTLPFVKNTVHVVLIKYKRLSSFCETCLLARLLINDCSHMIKLLRMMEHNKDQSFIDETTIKTTFAPNVTFNIRDPSIHKRKFGGFRGNHLFGEALDNDEVIPDVHLVKKMLIMHHPTLTHPFIPLILP